MTKKLDFETPDEILEYIKNQGKKTFKFSKHYEENLTTITFHNGDTIILCWSGGANYIHSSEEMLELYRLGKIKLVEEKIKIIHYPFKKIKRKKLTEREYSFLESKKDENKDFHLFEEIMKSIEMDKKFKKYLDEKDKI